MNLKSKKEMNNISIKKYKQDEVQELAKILKNDGVICVPTDTVYGLCASMNSVIGHKKLMEIKNRPENKLFSIMCADEKQIKEIAIVDDIAEKLIQSFMPGPITLILKKKNENLKYGNNDSKTIAVRMATSKTLKDLILKLGCPIFMSSANQSGEQTCNSINEVENTFPNLDGILEGTVSFGKASTIIDCTSKEIKILRSGPITLKELNEILNLEN